MSRVALNIQLIILFVFNNIYVTQLFFKQIPIVDILFVTIKK